MKFIYEFEMQEKLCQGCQFIRGEIFGTRIFCKIQKGNKRHNDYFEVVEECPLKIKEEK